MRNGHGFTERELDIMSVLWARGSGTVSEVRNRLGAPVGYTTVLKMLQILEDKGLVRHEREGRAYRYHPTVSSAEAGRSVLVRVVEKYFQGRVDRAVAALLSAAEATEDDLAEVRRVLAAAGSERPLTESPPSSED